MDLDHSDLPFKNDIKAKVNFNLKGIMDLYKNGKHMSDLKKKNKLNELNQFRDDLMK